MSDEVKSAEPRRLLALLEVELSPQFSDKAPLTIPLSELAGEVEEVTGANEGYVVGAGRAGSRELNPQGVEAVIKGCGHSRIIRAVLDGGPA